MLLPSFTVSIGRNHIVLQENAQHVSRFIALAAVNNPAKKKVRFPARQRISYMEIMCIAAFIKTLCQDFLKS